MKYSEALIRLLAISFTTLFTLICIVFCLRLFALKYPPNVSPMAQVTQLNRMIFSQGDLDHAPTHSLEGYMSSAFKTGNVHPMVEIRTTRDREWILFGKENLETVTNKTGPVEQWDWADLKDEKFKGSDHSLVRFEDFLKTIKPHHLMIFVHNKEVAGAKSLTRLLGEREEPMLTVVHAPAHLMNRELRKQRPLWYFGADSSHMTQWNLFSAFWLESWASLDFEWAFYTSKLESHTRLFSELKKRQVPLLTDQRAHSTTPNLDNDSSQQRIILTNRPTNWTNAASQK